MECLPLFHQVAGEGQEARLLEVVEVVCLLESQVEEVEAQLGLVIVSL